MQLPERNYEPVIAKGSEPTERVMVIAVNERSIHIDDRGRHPGTFLRLSFGIEASSRRSHPRNDGTRFPAEYVLETRRR
jgi:hypothetical protein